MFVSKTTIKQSQSSSHQPSFVQRGSVRCQVDAIGAKVREFSSELSAGEGMAGLSLSEGEVAPGGVLDGLLNRWLAALCPIHHAPVCILTRSHPSRCLMGHRALSQPAPHP